MDGVQIWIAQSTYPVWTNHLGISIKENKAMIEYSIYSLWFITCQAGEKIQKIWQVDVILGNCEEMLEVKQI